jgi:hypothetical protein
MSRHLLFCLFMYYRVSFLRFQLTVSCLSLFSLFQAIASDPLSNVDKEKTNILMYCTGGIRCDVYSTILRYPAVSSHFLFILVSNCVCDQSLAH